MVLYVSVLLFIPRKVQVLDVRGGHEGLQTIQPELDPTHLTLLHLRQEVDKVAKVTPSTNKKVTYISYISLHRKKPLLLKYMHWEPLPLK